MATLVRTFKIHPEQFSSFKIQKSQHDPFRTLVVTVLSQNSTDKGALRAFEELNRTAGEVSPENIVKTPVARIRRAIAVGGMQQQKAKGLKQLAQTILKHYNGNIAVVFEKPLEEARRELMALPRVGPKTADVLLVTSAGKPTIPIDTHCDRVSRRLGLAPLKGGYEKVRASLQGLYPSGEYHQVHLLLIAHGRAYCTALKPKCPICPVKKYCPYPYKSQA